MKLFGGGKPDHPLADPKEAKRVLDALPANDLVKALDELMHWMESVAALEGFRPEARVQLLMQLDDAAQVRVRKLAKDYFADARPSRFQENRLWTALHGWWKQAGYAYARSVDLFVQGQKGSDAAKSLLPQLLIRTLRSFAQHIKWMHMRYGPIDLASWGVFNSVYAFAEAKKLAQSKAIVYPGAAGESTPQLEFLKGVMFSASAPDGLLPVEVELAERFIAEFAPNFVLSPSSGPDLVFAVDLAQPRSPARMSRAPQATPGLRCFGAGTALAQVHALAEQLLTGGKLPPTLNLGGSYEPEVVREVLSHLEMCWSSQAPERKTQRHPVKSRLSVTHGYDAVVGVLGGGDSLNFDAQGSESWIVENVSAGGFGAVIPQLKGDWLRVGALLALQPQGGSNWVLGLVRRVNKLGPAQARVGIETLSKSPVLSQFAVSGAKGVSEHGVLIRNGEAAEARIVLRPGVFAPAQNLEIARGERQHVYIPQAIAERGEDYEIARFREMVRES
ncbi:MAG: hypothetical protein ACRET8_10600 [Burkholderiales bacterium]